MIVQGTSVGFGAIRVREADADGCVACLGQLKSIKLGDLQHDPAQPLVQLNSLDHPSKRVTHRLEAY